MTYLVTGATGFIGGRLVESLLARGDRVRALVRDPARATALGAMGVELVRGDVTDQRSLADAVAGTTRVYHCAAIVGDWLNPDVIARVNVDGTRSLLEACAKARVQRVLYVSSLAVLGTRHHHGTDETAPHAYTGDAYSDSKIDSERLALEFAKRGDVETVILRPGFVYGPGDRQFLPRFIDAVANGRFVYVGDGRKLLNIVYIDDVVQAALLADGAESAAGQAYNLTDGTETSLRDFVTAAAEGLGVPAPTRHLPPAVAWALCYVLEGIARARKAKEAPRLNRGRMKFLYYNQHFAIGKARRELGYHPNVMYREGLERSLDWFARAGLLPAAARRAASHGGHAPA
jgi:nucleoside-diphosphate-sugar epimerase